MFNIRYLNLISVIVFFLILAGCAGSDQNVRTVVSDTQETKPQTKISEDFDPMTLRDQNIQFPESQSSTPVYSLDQFLKENAIDSTNSEEMVPGYRVQLLSTRYEVEARTVKLDAVLTFKENVYVIFDNPYYKIRIGDCLTRFEANTLQEAAASKNFNEAWVVKTNVFRTPVLQEESEELEVITTP